MGLGWSQLWDGRFLSGKACWDGPEYRSLGSAAEPEQSLAIRRPIPRFRFTFMRSVDGHQPPDHLTFGR